MGASPRFSSVFFAKDLVSVLVPAAELVSFVLSSRQSNRFHVSSLAWPGCDGM
jgi:hypothetical protein